MTKDEILALPLDKLNELVAEKVVGECLHQHWDKNGQDHIECLRCGQDRFYHQESQEFHRDIAAAWRVQEKMFEKGYALSLVHRKALGRESVWYCDFRLHEMGTFPPETDWVDDQPSAPEAICRAALLAIEGKG